MFSFNSVTKKIRRDSLTCLTNPQISHRWGSEARNSPLVVLAHPEGLRPCFVTTARELSQCYINCTVRKAFKESMRDRFLYLRTLTHFVGCATHIDTNIKPNQLLVATLLWRIYTLPYQRLALDVFAYALLDGV